MPLLSFHSEFHCEAGCDEAGRGSLAGPVFAAAVILPPTFFHPELNDSKQLDEEQRSRLRVVIEKEAISYAVTSVEASEIDRINILQASLRAMHKAVACLDLEPELLLIDGNRFNPYPGIKHVCIIKGDGLYFSIAAASVLAKTYRDEYMQSLHNGFPQYNWLNNKGYPTREHRFALKQHGHCEHHRMSFRLYYEENDMFDESRQ